MHGLKYMLLRNIFYLFFGALGYRCVRDSIGIDGSGFPGSVVRPWFVVCLLARGLLLQSVAHLKRFGLRESLCDACDLEVVVVVVAVLGHVASDGFRPSSHVFGLGYAAYPGADVVRVVVDSSDEVVLLLLFPSHLLVGDLEDVVVSAFRLSLCHGCVSV